MLALRKNHENHMTEEMNLVTAEKYVLAGYPVE